MLKILPSNARSTNDAFREVRGRAGENNLAWFRRVLPKRRTRAALLLLGGLSPMAFRVRVAQSHARHDLTPSHWSHVALLTSGGGAPAGATLQEISLEPPAGFGYAPATNALQTGRLEHYADREAYPNIAVIELPVFARDLARALEVFPKQRAALDAVELLVIWLAFAWGVGRTGNPLLDGNGLPSAAMIEAVLGITGFEVTPTVPARESYPEAIWQAARWWHEYYEAERRTTRLRGAWRRDHVLVKEP